MTSPIEKFKQASTQNLNQLENLSDDTIKDVITSQKNLIDNYETLADQADEVLIKKQANQRNKRGLS